MTATRTLSPAAMRRLKPIVEDGARSDHREAREPHVGTEGTYQMCRAGAGAEFSQDSWAGECGPGHCMES